jgi:hypothetical protein
MYKGADTDMIEDKTRKHKHYINEPSAICMKQDARPAAHLMS